MSSILRITDPIPSDDSIDKYEDIEYEDIEDKPKFFWCRY